MLDLCLNKPNKNTCLSHKILFGCLSKSQPRPDTKIKKNIIFVTGTRADFGKLEPLITAARDYGHIISIFITGMHLIERYGLTKIEVKRMHGVSFHEFHNQSDNDSQNIILSKTICGFSDFIDFTKPDLVIVHGDRVEAMACAIVCATRYIRCGHIEGGEISGTIDEALRHCNTKLYITISLVLKMPLCELDGWVKDINPSM